MTSDTATLLADDSGAVALDFVHRIFPTPASSDEV